MLPTVAKQCDLGIIRNPFGDPVIEPSKLECEKCAMVLSPKDSILRTHCTRTFSCPNCLKNLST